MEIEAQRRLLGLVEIGNETSEQVNEEVDGAAMAGVFDLAHVLELIDDRFNGLITNDQFCWSRSGQLRLS